MWDHEAFLGSNVDILLSVLSKLYAEETRARELTVLYVRFFVGRPDLSEALLLKSQA